MPLWADFGDHIKMVVTLAQPLSVSLVSRNEKGRPLNLRAGFSSTGGRGFDVSFVPAPPSTPSLHTVEPSKSQHFARRPRAWVPPLVMLGAFSAGYAIPWDFSQAAPAQVAQFVGPLLLMTAMSLLAGFQTYRTRTNWRISTWIATALAFVATVNVVFSVAVGAPGLVKFMLLASTISLMVCAAFGAEPLSDIHRRPPQTPPGRTY